MIKKGKRYLAGILAAVLIMNGSGLSVCAEEVTAPEPEETISEENLIDIELEEAAACEDTPVVQEETVDSGEGMKTEPEAQTVQEEPEAQGEAEDDLFEVDEIDCTTGLYADVKETSGWRYEAINYVTQNGIMNGVGNNRFNPNGTLTRGMFVTVIYRMSGSPACKFDNMFPDVDANHYYSVPTTWANKMDIVNGHSNTGKFGAEENISRQDLVTILYRYAGLMDKDLSASTSYSGFKDGSKVSAYAQAAMSWAISRKIIKGRSDTGLLDPLGNASRVECAAIIQRFVSYVGISPIKSRTGGSDGTPVSGGSDSGSSSGGGSSESGGEAQDTDTLYAIMGSNSVTVSQMISYFSKYSSYPSFYSGTDAPTLRDFCQIYYEEAEAEGVRVEVAFCQAMKETGWLKYGGDVQIWQFNFAGIGATGGGAAGADFNSVREGVRVQIQHLKAYASTASLNNACIDPRFQYVKRGSAPYVQWLGKNENPNGYGWATAVNYGYDIVKRIKFLKSY